LRYFSCLLFLLLTTTLFPQEPAWKNIGIQQGLPSSEIYQVLQDKKGFIWFVSDAGVCRYDAEKITVFTTKEGLYENVVLGMYEDPKGRIWFRGLTGSLCYYEDGIISSIAANPMLCRLLKPNGIVTSLFLGSGDTLLCGTSMSIGLLKIVPAGRYGKVIADNSFPKNTPAYIVQPQPGTDLIYGRSRNIPDSVTPFLYLKLPNSPARLLALPENINTNYFKYLRSADGTIYLLNHMSLLVINGTSVNVKKYPTSLLSAYVDQDNNLWLGTYKEGLLCYPHSDLCSTPLVFLKKYSVSSILFDRENSLWISTLEKGVMQTLNRSILHFEGEDMKVGSFYRDDTVLYIGLNQQSRVLEATSRKGIIGRQSIPSDVTVDIMGMVRMGTTLVYATSSGVFFSKKPGQFKRLVDDQNIYPRVILAMNDTQLAMTSHAGLLLTDLYTYSRVHTLPEYDVCTAKTADGRLLFGTSAGILEWKDNRFQPSPDPLNALHTRVNTLTEGPGGALWAGTNEDGLFIFQGKSSIHFQEKDGLVSNKIYDIVHDGKGDTWVASNKGLTRISYHFQNRQYELVTYNETDGLPSNEILKIASIGDKIYCASREGFFYFNPVDLIKNNAPPGIIISSFLLNGTPLPANETGELPYNRNNLNITLSRLSYKGNGTSNFLIMLKGYDPVFHLSSYSNINYTNLPPGRYSFIVYALNNNGLRSAIPAMISFGIGKPFWWRAWFILSVGLMSVLSIYLCVRWRLQRVQQRAEEKTDFSRKLAEYKMTALQAQMNPHFVFNAINSIQHYILTNKPEAAYQSLAHFALLVRLVLKNSQQKTIPLDQEIETLKLYLELEEIRFSIPFTYSIMVDEELDTEDTYLVPMLIQPFVENAIKHGLMPRKDIAKLNITIGIQGTSLHITIIDNGIGREASQHTKRTSGHVSTGIENTTERARLMSEYAGGAATITITDLYDAEGKAAGTNVELIIPSALE
jgi:ligand-binding sensor domain-containing protein/anti-sigma regulatory factor (Ser/Thr protein kinase)